MDIIIVCHTEFGEVINKKVVAIRKHDGVIKGVTNLDRIANKHGAKITYAVCPEVAQYFPKVNGEVGLHIHPGWQEFESQNKKFIVGDIYLKQNCVQSSTSTVLRDYPLVEQYDMIMKGLIRIVNVLGVMPSCFVAGRWSINNDTVKALLMNKISRDCSAAASLKDGHFDWSRLPKVCMPYYASENDYQSEGDSELLIIPISQMRKGGNVNIELVPRYTVKWLELCFLEYYHRKLPLFHICLHSPCMTDDYFIKAMDRLLGFIAKHKVNFKFVSEINKYE